MFFCTVDTFLTPRVHAYYIDRCEKTLDCFLCLYIQLSQSSASYELICLLRAPYYPVTKYFIILKSNISNRKGCVTIFCTTTVNTQKRTCTFFLSQARSKATRSYLVLPCKNIGSDIYHSKVDIAVCCFISSF